MCEQAKAFLKHQHYRPLTRLPYPALENVTLTSNPPGALVSFSRMAVCYTPCVTKLQAQRYNVTMKLAGYAEWTGEITVEAGKPSTVAAELQRQTE